MINSNTIAANGGGAASNTYKVRGAGSTLLEKGNHHHAGSGGGPPQSSHSYDPSLVSPKVLPPPSSGAGENHLPYIKNKSGNIILFTTQNGQQNQSAGPPTSHGSKQPVMAIATTNTLVRHSQPTTVMNSIVNNQRASLKSGGGPALSFGGQEKSNGGGFLNSNVNQAFFSQNIINGLQNKNNSAAVSPVPTTHMNPMMLSALQNAGGGNFLKSSKTPNVLAGPNQSNGGQTSTSTTVNTISQIQIPSEQNKQRRIYVIDSQQPGGQDQQHQIKSLSFNVDQGALKGLFVQSSANNHPGKRNSSHLRGGLIDQNSLSGGMSNMTSLNQHQHFVHKSYLNEKLASLSEPTPKEMRHAVNGSQLSIFSSDQVRKGAGQQQHTFMQIKGNEVVTGATTGAIALSGTNTTNATLESTGDTPSKKVKLFENYNNALLGNKKSSIDVSAMLEKIQTFQGGSPKNIGGGSLSNNGGQSFKIQARLKSKNTHKSKDALEENMGGGGSESYRRGAEKTLLAKNMNKGNNESSRVMLNAIAQNAAKPDRTSQNFQQQSPQLLSAVIEGSSIQHLQKPRRQGQSSKERERQKRNINRKHLIHQQIKCQGIPVVNGGTIGTALCSENTTHFGGFSTKPPMDSGQSPTSQQQDEDKSNIDVNMFVEIAQNLANIHRSPGVFDHEESLKMIQNYSSLLMKDAKFRDNILLAGAAQNGTPYIQYLIKNNKAKKALEFSNNNQILDELEISLSRLKAAANGTDVKPSPHLGGSRSQTSLLDISQSRALQDETNLLQASLDNNNETTQKKRYNLDNTNLNIKVQGADNESPYREYMALQLNKNQNESQRSPQEGGLPQQQTSVSKYILQKTQTKFIHSMKRYASKERFLKLLDQIAQTAMKESVDMEGSEDFQQRLREASNWLIQEQLKQRAGQDKLNKNFHLKGTQAFASRQAATPNYCDKRVSSNFQALPMKIQQIQRHQEMPQDDSVDEGERGKGKGSQVTPPVKRNLAAKAPLVPNKPKIRLDNLLLLSPIVINMPDINELFHQINRLLTLTIKFKDTYSNLHIQEIKYQAISLGLKLSNQDLQLSFLKSNAFISMLRAKVSSLVNRFIIPSFPAPCGIASLGKIVQRQINENALQAQNGGPTPLGLASKSVFKFWVENSGNNHPLVKQICKRRNWLIWAADYTPPAWGPSGAPQELCVRNYPVNHEDDEADIKQQVGGPHLIWTQLRRLKILRELTLDQIYNHIDGINLIATKSGLFLTLKKYYEERQMNIFEAVPETYLINVDHKPGQTYNSEKDQQLEEFQRVAGNNIWILKPGENTNRGHGIQIFNDVKKIIQSINNEYYGQYKTVVLQKYIPNPYLISKRKFDFRVYALLTYNFIPVLGGPPIKLLRGYFYEEGYLRTSCKEFTLKSIHNKYVHLTNDAVQKYSQDYGKFENGNKISYEDFKGLLMKERGIDFTETILQQIKQRIRETFEAAGPKLVGEVRYDYNGFELMGFDFMLDSDLKLYLIECNTNPCLETNQSILLQRIIPQVLDQTCKIAVDPFLRANEQQYANASEISLTEFKYEMVYEQKFEHLRNLLNVSPTRGTKAGRASSNNMIGAVNNITRSLVADDEELHPGELVLDSAAGNEDSKEDAFEEEEEEDDEK